MLELKKLLMGANTSTPALNDLAKLVATKLPGYDIDCNDLAGTIMSVTFDVRRNHDCYRANYPHLFKFVKQGGDMCSLSAMMTQVIDTGTSANYAKRYRETSIKFFGE